MQYYLTFWYEGAATEGITGIAGRTGTDGIVVHSRTPALVMFRRENRIREKLEKNNYK